MNDILPNEMPVQMVEKKKVMIIDDNITNLTVAKKALESDYAVLPVSSGEKALAFLERAKPALILLDIEMPDMDGFETLRQIKRLEHAKDIPVLFLTARYDNISELEGLRLGAVDYIRKPFSVPLLLERVKLQIERAGRRDRMHTCNEQLNQRLEQQTEIITQLQQAISGTLRDFSQVYEGTDYIDVARTRSYLAELERALRESYN